MFHRKRFRSAAAVILALLLAAALAPVVSAQNGLPPPPDPPAEVTPAPTDPAPPEPGPTPVPTGPPDPPDPPNGPPDPPDPNGNGDMNGDTDDDMKGTPSSHSWPPPNAIVRHAATPVQISAHGGALNVYFVAAGSDVTSGPVIASISDLAEMHPGGGAVELFSGANPGSGKSVMIHYLPDDMKIRVSTYYADNPPHDYNKPYVFTVDADHSVNHERW